tara:strand:+ start:3323 stop:3631 length:309 start_codon:yes stop_codon:yes gene_type:complete
MNQEQNHPLHLIDREILNRLLSKDSPDEKDLIDLARLIIRYEGFPGAVDLQMDLKKILKLWGLTKDSLNSKTKAIWAEGFRPGKNESGTIGSGFDTADEITS